MNSTKSELSKIVAVCCFWQPQEKTTLYHQNVRELLMAESVTIRVHEINVMRENNSQQYRAIYKMFANVNCYIYVIK